MVRSKKTNKRKKVQRGGKVTQSDEGNDEFKQYKAIFGKGEGEKHLIFQKMYGDPEVEYSLKQFKEAIDNKTNTRPQGTPTPLSMEDTPKQDEDDPDRDFYGQSPPPGYKGTGGKRKSKTKKVRKSRKVKRSRKSRKSRRK